MLFRSLHPVPEKVSLAASTSGLPELALEYRHCLCRSDHHYRDPYGIDQGDKEIEHLFRPAAFCKAQVLYFIYDQYPDLVEVDQLRHQNHHAQIL